MLSAPSACRWLHGGDEVLRAWGGRWLTHARSGSLRGATSGRSPAARKEAETREVSSRSPRVDSRAVRGQAVRGGRLP